MEQSPINQRLKILAEMLDSNARSIGLAVGESSTNAHKYINGNTRPSPEFLEKLLLRFGNINAHWLLTGEGEALASDSVSQTQEPNVAYTKSKNFSNSQVVGKNAHKVSQKLSASSDVAVLQELVEQLRSQLADKDKIITSKDEVITMLKDLLKK